MPCRGGGISTLPSDASPAFRPLQKPLQGGLYKRATATIPATPAKAMLATSSTPAADEGSTVEVVVVEAGGGRTPVPVGAEDVVPLENAVSVCLLRVMVWVRVVVEVMVVVVVGSSEVARATAGRKTAATSVRNFIVTGP
jgi:hypothetical protein